MSDSRQATAHAYQQTRHERLDEEALLRAIRAITSTLDVQEVQQAVLDVVEELFDVQAVVLSLYDQQSASLQVRAFRGPGAADAGTPPSAPQEAALEVLARGKPIYVPENGFGPCSGRGQQPSGPTSYLCVPLLVEGHAVGTLELFFSGEASASPATEKTGLVCAIAAQAAIAIRNAERFACARQTAREELAAEAERLKDEFVSMVSHELRTPLTAIKGCAKTLLRHHDRLEPQVRRQLLLDLNAESERLHHLVDNLVDLARAEAGTLRMATEPTSVARVAHKLADALASRELEQEIVLSFPDNLPPVEADPLRLEHVLRNLLDNAIKHSPPGAAIEVRGEVRGGELVVSVTDAGPGIDLEHQERIFERFYRTRGAGISGAGLGLTICRRLVEAMGGRIWVSSEPGHGATFAFTLPLAEPVGPPGASKRSTPRPPCRPSSRENRPAQRGR